MGVKKQTGKFGRPTGLSAAIALSGILNPALSPPPGIPGQFPLQSLAPVKKLPDLKNTKT